MSSLPRVDKAHERHSWALGMSRMSMGSLLGVDYQGVALMEADFSKFRTQLRAKEEAIRIQQQNEVTL